MLEKLFRLKENGTSVRREIVAGFTTFTTLSYIIFVQPTLLSIAGMDSGAVMVATCLSSAGATILMAFMTNYPVALAPGMGINAYFVFSVCNNPALNLQWQDALGLVFISGMLFVILSFVGLREAVMNALPSALHNAIAVGIGLFIAFIGLQMSGIITIHGATYVSLGNIHSTPVLVSIFGILVILTLLVLRVRGAILMGILATTAVALIVGTVEFVPVTKWVSTPPSIEPTLFKFSFKEIFSRIELIPIIFVFFSVDMFDSIGTLTATGHEADLLEDGKLSKARQALLTDAIGSVGGACLGTSTVTCYIESASGIAEGGRTGLTSVVVGILMLLALFFSPLIAIVGGDVISSTTTAINGTPTTITTLLHPIIGPALIAVGCLMLKDLININWDDFTESIPAALTVFMMPLSFSITEGIAFGFISISFLKIVTGRYKEVNPLVHYFAIFFVARYIGFA
ncbi:MAG: NCS2 family permease [Candidatus Poribacteria bacterium]|nr:NCS2 family permease [Candidatus Poribacteria bacterium]